MRVVGVPSFPERLMVAVCASPPLGVRLCCILRVQ